MKEAYLRDDGSEKAEAQLLFFRSMFNKDITQLHLLHCDSKSCRKSKDKFCDEEDIKERFKTGKMYYQAMKPYCKITLLKLVQF